MALNISPPLNINNLFGTWLNGVPKTEKVHIRVGTYAISWAIWHVRNDFIFNKSHFPLFFTGYSFGYPLDPYMVLSPTYGAPSGHGYLVQPFGNGSTGYIQPIRVAV
jgi:hypothetical protein